MAITVIYPTSAEFWLEKNPELLAKYDLDNRHLSSLPTKSKFDLTSFEALSIANFWNFKSPIHVACPSYNFKHRPGFICHCYTHAFPTNSFLKISRFGQVIYVASPELTFLLAAATLDFISLAELGFNLCAIYSIDKSTGQHYNRPPVTTSKLLRKYISLAPSFYGIKKARMAAKYILDNSNSPIESKLALIGILPIHKGGYGLPHPEMNGSVKLSSASVKLLGYSQMHADLIWGNKRVALEYNSNAFHLDAKQYAADMARINAYKSAGYSVIPVTADNIRTVDALDSIMRHIRKELSLKFADPQLDKFYFKRRETFNQIFKRDSFFNDLSPK